MKRGKLVLSLTTLVVIILLVSVVVSAGFLDFFKKDEPQFGPFDASVNVGNAPPRIIDFIPVVENPDDLSSLAGQIQPVPGSTVDARVIFIVQDPNGPVGLPGVVVPSDGAPALVAADIALSLTAPANGISSTVRSVDATSCFATECASGTNPNCNTGNFAIKKQYTCDVTMQYYDEPAISNTQAGDLWSISATIRDVPGLTDTATSATIGPFDALNYMEYLTTTGVSNAAVTLAWSTLDVATDDVPADSGLTLTNIGNVAVADELVTAQNLVEDGVPTNYIEVSAFSSGPSAGGANSGACDAPGGGGTGTGGVALVHGAGVVAPVPIGFTATGTDSGTINFCVWDALNNGHIQGLPAISYVANSANSNQWNVVWNS